MVFSSLKSSEASCLYAKSTVQIAKSKPLFFVCNMTVFNTAFL